MYPVRARRPKFEQHLETGRVTLGGMCIGLPYPVLAFVIYGWTNGRCDVEAARRTSLLLEACTLGAGCHPDTCVCIVGDLNAGSDYQRSNIYARISITLT